MQYQTPADNPLVIIGFHRSGTTMLHRLLESDKQFVTPVLWEMMEPLPPGRVEDFKNSPRYLKAKKEFGECQCHKICIISFCQHWSLPWNSGT